MNSDSREVSCRIGVGVLWLLLSAGTCLGQCNFFSPPVDADEPDSGFTDANGDGIDGMACGPIFVAVTGSDENPGTMDAPLATIQAAVLQARLMTPTRKVYVSAEGNVPLNSLVILDGVSVYGGFNAGAGWTRSSARSLYNPNVGFADAYQAGFVPPQASQALVVYAQAISQPMVLDSLQFLSKVGNRVSPSTDFGLFVEGGPSGSLELRNVRVEALPPASLGLAAGAGTNGLQGASANAGANGLVGCEDCTSNGTSAPGGSGAFNGGGGGPGGQAVNGVAGQTGSGPGGSAGVGGSSAPCNATAGNGGFAQPGAIGSNGAHGGVGPLWSNGLSGTTGSAGRGGGGGGGGGGVTQVFLSCDTGRGGGGGGGGGGGFPGSPGTGGLPGVSAASMVWNGNGSVLADSSCHFRAFAQNGGIGGNGGAGGNGGNGGLGGSGPGATGAGGNGGAGGRGGHAGSGSGGSGGSAFASLSLTGGPSTSIAGALIELGGGIGGLGGTTPGFGTASSGPNGTSVTHAVSGVTAPSFGTPGNRAPTGVRCIIRCFPDTPSAPTVALAADPDISDSHTFQFSQPLFGGTVAKIGESFIFTPAPGFTGWTWFNLSAVDSGGLKVTGRAVVFVGVDPDPPVEPCTADVDDGSGTGTPDGGVTIDDLLYFLNRYNLGC
ncbi:MAG: GC-type dockerin domain-anchored protein [Phycisphaerales bacterium]